MKNYLETFNQTVEEAQKSPDGYAVMVIDPPKREEPEVEAVRLTYYERTINALDPNVNPMAVEAQMRLKYGTLDHLPREEFKREIGIYKQVIRDDSLFATEAIDYPRQLCFENISRFEKIEAMIALEHRPAQRTLKLVSQPTAYDIYMNSKDD